MRTRTIFAAIVACMLGSASPVYAQPSSCQIIGEVPQELMPYLCEMGTFAHGMGEPSNGLTVIVTDDIAGEIRSGSLSARTLLISMLGAWMRLRQVDVARVDILHGCCPIALVQKKANGETSLEFY